MAKTSCQSLPDFKEGYSIELFGIEIIYTAKMVRTLLPNDCILRITVCERLFENFYKTCSVLRILICGAQEKTVILILEIFFINVPQNIPGQGSAELRFYSICFRRKGLHRQLAALWQQHIKAIKKEQEGEQRRKRTLAPSYQASIPNWVG